MTEVETKPEVEVKEQAGVLQGNEAAPATAAGEVSSGSTEESQHDASAPGKQDADADSTSDSAAGAADGEEDDDSETDGETD